MPVQLRKEGFFAGFFCGGREKQEDMGCKCGDKCPWMEHWLSLSVRTLGRGSNALYALSREADEQIKKDLKRTQPNSPAFQT